MTLALSLFDQFESPVYLGIPLIVLALILPAVILPTPTPRWLENRLLATQNWFIGQFTHQVFLPVGVPGHKWAVILASLMLYLTSLNMLGLLPYTFTPTAQLSINLALAFPLWLATVIIGLRNQPTQTFGHLLPEGTPTPLIPILIIIETISLFIRPVALSVRLTANLTAGHLLIHLIAMAVAVLLPLMPVVAIPTAILLLLLMLLEIAVAVIQAYVFVLLLSLYLQENV
uniref:ATP synthase subunit a n=1 Tax=Schedophilus medusophagus TaxID=546535 RepID=A0A7G9M2T6_9SCOM|nr:ATP synthase F0 subunit 6 [Neogobius melanostomus]YP_009990547.1 ATP synthase F0 subunit 6 [Schedophilus medusophagus]QNM99654.1 ATP synthase F0 subunit 6 [Schedophilus medusophagus]QNM99862.1 ATP synthase F0 subunit 6 [Schedophilus medusophagus]